MTGVLLHTACMVGSELLRPVTDGLTATGPWRPGATSTIRLLNDNPQS